MLTYTPPVPECRFLTDHVFAQEIRRLANGSDLDGETQSRCATPRFFLP